MAGERDADVCEVEHRERAPRGAGHEKGWRDADVKAGDGRVEDVDGEAVLKRCAGLPAGALANAGTLDLWPLGTLSKAERAAKTLDADPAEKDDAGGGEHFESEGPFDQQGPDAHHRQRGLNRTGRHRAGRRGESSTTTAFERVPNHHRRRRARREGEDEGQRQVRQRLRVHAASSITGAAHGGYLGNGGMGCMG